MAQHDWMAGWLEAPASAAPAPGGGAAAAMNVAIAAALLSMVCHLTIGKPRYADADHARMGGESAHRGCEAGGRGRVSVPGSQHGLPAPEFESWRGSRAESSHPRGTAGRGRPPSAHGGRSCRGDPSGAGDAPWRQCQCHSDVGAAAVSARAGLSTAALNVETNLAVTKDAERRETLSAALARYSAAISNRRRGAAPGRGACPEVRLIDGRSQTSIEGQTSVAVKSLTAHGIQPCLAVLLPTADEAAAW